MVGSTPHRDLIEGQQRTNQRIMKRNNSSAEDMVRSMIKPKLDRTSLESAAPQDASSWRIADRLKAFPKEV